MPFFKLETEPYQTGTKLTGAELGEMKNSPRIINSRTIFDLLCTLGGLYQGKLEIYFL